VGTQWIEFRQANESVAVIARNAIRAARRADDGINELTGSETLSRNDGQRISAPLL